MSERIEQAKLDFEYLKSLNEASFAFAKVLFERLVDAKNPDAFKLLSNLAVALRMELDISMLPLPFTKEQFDILSGKETEK